MKHKKLASAILSAVCAFCIGAAAYGGNAKVMALDYDGAVSNSFGDYFVASGCTTDKYAATYTAYKNDETTVFKQYNGYNAKFNGVGSSVEYKKAVDVTDNTGSDVIFEFIPAVEKQGTREFYKFSVYLTDEQNADKYIKLEFKANGDYYIFVNASAKDGDTEFKSASKLNGAYKADNGFQTGFGLSGYGGNESFQSIRLYWDNTKKTIEVGAPKSNGSVTRNTVVRDFSIPDGELGIDGYTGTEVFGGFTSGKIKVKVVAENVITNYANMTFIAIDGEKFARPFGLTASECDAIAGDEITLPSVKDCWNVKSGKAIESVAAEIKVTDPKGGAVEVVNGKFTATVTGVYSAKYYTEQDGVTYLAEYEITAGSNKNNNFYESFKASDCTPSEQAVTYTALTNKETEYKVYNGYHVKFNKRGAIVEYNKAVDVTDNTGNDVIFEFIPSVEKQGTREFYKFNVYFIDEQDENKYIKLEFKANQQYYTFINASAKDGDKEFKPASKYQGAYYSDADNDRGNGFQTGFGTSGYGGTQSFQSYRIYWDNAKKTIEVGASREGNSVVRDFSIPDGELGIDGYTGNDAFGGFTSGKVKVRVEADNVLTSYANMTFISIDGESFARSSGVTLISKGVAGKKYALPAPSEVYDVQKGAIGKAADVKYTATVKDPDGESVAIEDGAFIPTKTGEYEITYEARYNGNGSVSKTILTVVSEDGAPEIILETPTFESEYFGKQTLNLIADASSELYYNSSYKPTITLEISVGGGEFTAVEPTEDTQVGYGKYELKYTATDYVGRTVQKTLKFEVRRNRLSFADGVNETSVYNDGESIEVSQGDVVLYDAEADGDFATKTVTIEIAHDEGEFEPYDDEYEFGTGKYTVKYTVAYALVEGGETYTATATRTIVINDLIPPVFGKGCTVENVYKDFRNKDTHNTYYVITTTGKTVKFSNFTASDTRKDGTVDLTSAITVRYKKGDDLQTIVNYDKENGLSFVAEKDTVYCYSFVVSDGSNEVSRNYIIAVKDFWLTAEFGEDEYGAEIGKEFAYEDKLTVKSVDGTSIDGATIKWEFDGEELSGKLVPSKKGNFVLKAVITAGDQTVELTTVLAVKGVKQPIISVNEETLTVTVGEYFDLPKASAEGGEGKIAIKIFITAPDGNKTQINGETAVVNDEGEYTITYEATDSVGTTATKTVKVIATKKTEEKPKSGCGSCKGSASGVAAAAGLALLAAVYAIGKKR